MRLLSILLLTSVANGQFLPGVDPRLPDAEATESLPTVKATDDATAGTGEVLCEQLLAIHLETYTGGTLSELAPGLQVASDLIVPSPQTLVSKLAAWKGRSLSTGDLVAIADLILIHYDVEGYPVVGVEAPEQDFKNQTLRLTLEIGRIGNIGVGRPKYGNPKVISKGISLRKGALLRRSDIDRQMSWFGRTIFRKPQLLVSPGTEPATADILIGLAEKKPWRVGLGYENSGPTTLGRDRFTLGVAGMLPNEHILSWQTVVGSPVKTMQANAVNWEIPFPQLQQTLQIDGVYAEVLSFSENSGLPVENTGVSWSVGATQKFTLPTIGKWRQSLAAGVQLKSTNQFVLFGGAQFSPGEVRFADATITYGIGRDWENGAFSVTGSLLGSPGGLVDGNDDEDFQVYDPEASASYLKTRWSADGWWSPGGDWRIALRGSAQLADSRLLPVEQFSAGGYQTVRGASELEEFADKGLQGNLELYTPALIIKDLCQVRLLGFIDQAVLKNRGEAATSLSGAGIGARMQVSEHVDFRIDQGWRLDANGSETHVGLQINF